MNLDMVESFYKDEPIYDEDGELFLIRFSCSSTKTWFYKNLANRDLDFERILKIVREKTGVGETHIGNTPDT